MDEVANDCNENSNIEEGKSGANDMSGFPASSINSGKDNDARNPATPDQGRPLSLSSVNIDSQGVQNYTAGDKIYEPRKYDVLLGRGRPLQDHPGNLRFHKIINRARALYVSSRKEDKAGIAKEVMNEIKTSKKKHESDGNQSPTIGDDGEDDVPSPSSGGEPGRFLKKVGDANVRGETVHWVEVSQEVAIEKISHALRGRQRSETKNRSDQSKIPSTESSETSLPGAGTATVGKLKRKGPPSPPANETAPFSGSTDAGLNIPGTVATGDAAIKSSEETAQQNSSATDTIFNIHVDNGNSIPIPAANDAINNQLQAMLPALQLQQFPSAVHFQSQNTQQMAQNQLVHQILQQQQMLSTAGVGTTPAFGQNQQPALNTEAIGQLLAQQQQFQLLQFQLLLQQQQTQQLLQQQVQLLQPQQVQYQMPQNYAQPHRAQQQQAQQQQVAPTIQPAQQTHVRQQPEQSLQQQQEMNLLTHSLIEQGNAQQQQPQVHPPSYQQQQRQSITPSAPIIGNSVSSSIADGATGDPNLANSVAAIISASQLGGGSSSVGDIASNQNQVSESFLLGALRILSTQLPQFSPHNLIQNPQLMASQGGSSQVVAASGSQPPRRQQQQQQQLTPLNPQQSSQRPSSSPNSNSLPTSEQQPQYPSDSSPPNTS